MTKSPITSHVLDTATGQPAAGLPVQLSRLEGETWQTVDEAITDADGRIMTWRVPDQDLGFGTYRLRFQLQSYLGDSAFYPYADVVFALADERHHHIPLLLSPFGYSTYRGS
ncbi:hydroxyisourate hydrolase [Reinekea blandensis]|uniref:5-hydroxyisourate hydrolase n=1 Tax=Reinekea blandensis MED297 TaxID=314283 RepID=A4BD01_9GAMM|nr:hydroxyisourate hydrolase [Reinekea blandensis]EAR10083.1 hypothetical protein MED297_08341 [Reinekea sp. MED297] [Reinekea blandensis MED297]